MNWDNLPKEIILIIMLYRQQMTCGHIKKLIKIQSLWRYYKIKILVKRFKMLRYLKEFKIWNPNINEFIIRSKL